ncbi:MAG: HlyD family secretion protein [Isosphaeraceae bacterium]
MAVIAAVLVVLSAAAVAGYQLIPRDWLPGYNRSPKNLILPGVVEVQEVRLGSKVGGRVREVHVLEGDRVEPGTPLVTLDVPELEAQQLQWRAKLRSDQAALEKARNGPRRVEIAAAAAAVAAAGARHDRLKHGYREEEIREARSDWLSSEADLKLAEENFGRYEALLRRNSTTQGQVDSARADFDRARGRAAASRAHYDLVAKGSRPEEVAEAAALLDQARANLDLLKAGTRAEDIAALEAQVEQTRARLSEVEANLAEAVVHSPSKAVIDVISVRKGDLVAAGQAVVRVLQADDLWVKVFIPETELGRVRMGQEVEVTVDSHPGVRFHGRFVQISHESEFTPRNIQSVDERRHQVFSAKVRVDDAHGVFKSGMAAVVSVPLDASASPARPDSGRRG